MKKTAILIGCLLSICASQGMAGDFKVIKGARLANVQYTYSTRAFTGAENKSTLGDMYTSVKQCAFGLVGAFVHLADKFSYGEMSYAIGDWLNQAERNLFDEYSKELYLRQLDRYKEVKYSHAETLIATLETISDTRFLWTDNLPPFLWVYRHRNS